MTFNRTISQRSIAIHYLPITLLHQNPMLLKLPDATKPHTLTDSYRHRKVTDLIWYCQLVLEAWQIATMS